MFLTISISPAFREFILLKNCKQKENRLNICICLNAWNFDVINSPSKKRKLLNVTSFFTLVACSGLPKHTQSFRIRKLCCEHYQYFVADFVPSCVGQSTECCSFNENWFRGIFSWSQNSTLQSNSFGNLDAVTSDHTDLNINNIKK